MSTTYATKKLPFVRIHADERCQARTERHKDVVQEYADALTAKADLPPIDVFMVGETPWIVDGFHRFYAHAVAEIPWVRCRIVGTGTEDQAIWLAVAANATNGMRRTNEDKRKAVRMALESTIGAEQSSRVIAEHLGVGDQLVNAIRAEMEAARIQRCVNHATDVPPAPAKRKGRDGREYNATKPARTPKERVVLDEPTPEPADVAHEYPVEDDEPLPHEVEPSTSSTSNEAGLPSYGAELERVASAVARVRVEARKAQLPNGFLQGIESGLKSVESMLRYAIPEVCPRCQGSKCLHCRQRGWVERSEGEQLRASVKVLAR